MVNYAEVRYPMPRSKVLVGLTVASLMILLSECECVEDMMYELKAKM